MNEYSKDKIVNFFESVVKPVLTEFATDFEKHEWEIDLQIPNPDEPSHWFNNELGASINVSKDGEAWLHYFCIAATPTPSSKRYHVMYKKTFDQPPVPVLTVTGGTFEGEYPRDINTVSKEQFRKDVEKQEALL
jgi:hypothetical protein